MVPRPVHDPIASVRTTQNDEWWLSAGWPEWLGEHAEVAGEIHSFHRRDQHMSDPSHSRTLSSLDHPILPRRSHPIARRCRRSAFRVRAATLENGARRKTEYCGASLYKLLPNGQGRGLQAWPAVSDRLKIPRAHQRDGLAHVATEFRWRRNASTQAGSGYIVAQACPTRLYSTYLYNCRLVALQLACHLCLVQRNRMTNQACVRSKAKCNK